MKNPLTIPARRTPGRWRTLGFLLAAVALAMASFNPAQSVAGEQRGTRPTIVLVHGSWADASSWNRVTERLRDDGYAVRALPNPLRSVASDSASVRAFLETVPGPVVLVGHSYGGFVISNAATGLPNVKALVYVNSFAPEAGETPFQLVGPDSALAVDPATVFDLVPADQPPTATTDVYLKRSAVFSSFATGLDHDDKDLVFATQRPGAFGALNDPSGTPAWKTIPSWSLIGTDDQIIPAAEQRKMSQRAGATITEYEAGHLGLMTRPGTVTRVIGQAAHAVSR
ncbi:alpha/beta fold hydrolase [Kribbella shirazensis]|uniref:Pimeloyl-ACP methyl ester carboxylesterase n=1 Tax=Kribbella shirazensis TaxID=1105143 RepID=A0A7X5VHI0_9ACTN|nr:alpha/beta hydrolase [Kribbella shirazensis]NIK61329.1 pimeloyl-ACP methyl ester carboxylesterase [Kribbella shirazensis]